MQIRHIASRFLEGERIRSVEPFGQGHIHRTFLIACERCERNTYVLQQMNTHVFPDPKRLMENIVRVTEHIRSKAEERGGNPARATLTIVPSRDGELLFTAEDGSFWRMFHFVENTFALDVAETSAQCREAGAAFGIFQRLLSDLSCSSISETIPGFHRADVRIAQLRDAVAADSHARLESASAQVEHCLSRAAEMGKIDAAADAGDIPRRITHNDTKLNNVLFDRTSGKAVCVVDLDTVMPGYLPHDFGDSIRTTAATTREDDPDPGNININLSFFSAFASGFLSQTRELLTQTEIELLPFSVAFFPYIMAVRMLTDYLKGDVYYRTDYPGHNLDRTRNQLALFDRAQMNEGRLREEIKSILQRQ